jgi:uncharacterized membrane protein
MPATALGTVHMIAAAVSLLVGAFQLLRTRRDGLHRRLGYVFVAAMVVTNLSALTVYEFNGRFNTFHAFALISLVSVAMALRPMIASPRPPYWRRMHYYWVSWSYVGLAAAAVTEFLLRVVQVRGDLAAVIGSPPVILIGAWLINRFAPAQRPARA